jgi:tetratricopeptide (TPR) repeat protein
LPESPGRDGRELEIGDSVSNMAYFTKGNAAPEIIDHNKRVAELAEKSGNLTLLAVSASNRAAAAFGAGDLRAAGMLADQALELALREGDAGRLAFVRGLQIFTRHASGDLAGVEEHFAAGLKFFDDPNLWLLPGLAVSAFAFASFNAWMLGRSDVARERMARSIAAGNGNSPYNLAFSTSLAAQLRVYLREYEQAEPLAARAIELSEQHKFQMVAALSRAFLGIARAQLGHATEGIALIRQAIAGALEIGMPSGAGAFTGLLAAAQEREGAIADALATVEQALQTNPDELAYRPEILRLRGELRLKQGETDLAEADFRKVIEMARSKGAKALELRAKMSLAEMLAQQGRRDEARGMLAEIYGWFSEGFDTADLKDAKALLEDLAGPANSNLRTRF